MPNRAHRSLLPSLASVVVLSSAGVAGVIAPPATPGGIERAVRLRELPFLDSRISVGSFSSHGRDGTNTDASVLTDRPDPRQRTYLYRDSAGRYVVLDLAGPGAITRMWMTQLGTEFGNTRDAGRMQIFFDDEPTPRVDLPAAELFAGLTPPFLAPLCADFRPSSGGNYCYVTMPFRRSARIAFTGQPSFWNFQYERYPEETPVDTFDPTSPALREQALDAAGLWSEPASDPVGLAPGTAHAGSAVVPPGGSPVVLVDLAGPGTLRSIELALDPATDAD
ncbi:MAG: DUF2961 domain-containing protein, partial [Candidatus Binatia bacterium]